MTSDFAAGNYRFIPAVFQYSAALRPVPDLRSSGCASTNRSRWPKALRESRNIFKERAGR